MIFAASHIDIAERDLDAEFITADRLDPISAVDFPIGTEEFATKRGNAVVVREGSGSIGRVQCSGVIALCARDVNSAGQTFARQSQLGEPLFDVSGVLQGVGWDMLGHACASCRFFRPTSWLKKSARSSMISSCRSDYPLIRSARFDTVHASMGLVPPIASKAARGMNAVELLKSTNKRRPTPPNQNGAPEGPV